MIVNGREYRWPARPTVVVCLDGSSFDYIEAAIDAGVAPYLQSLVAEGQWRIVDAALPSFTNPNNVSIVTGVPPSVHGITGNFFLDRETGGAVMMNDASFLRAETILAAFSRVGARVAVVTAKDKLRRLLAHGLDGTCVSIESTGVEVYSAALSERALEESARILRAEHPDLLYISTSDYVQHKHAPGDAAANQFYASVDRSLAAIDDFGATLVVVADHGMRAKADASGDVRAVWLQDIVDSWSDTNAGADLCVGPGAGTQARPYEGGVRVILPITDPYVLHHGSLGSCAMVYAPAAMPTTREPEARRGEGISASSRCGRGRAASAEMLVAHLAREIAGLPGVDLALTRDEACARFELPPDRIGDIVVFADGETVIGTRAGDHDLSALDAPLRSHGGRAEQRVPLIANRVIGATARRNYDAFAVALND